METGKRSRDLKQAGPIPTVVFMNREEYLSYGGPPEE